VALKFKDFGNVRTGYAFRKSVAHLRDGDALLIQPKNITPEGLITFGKEPPLRTDKSKALPLQPQEVLIVNRGRFAAAVFNLPSTETWIVPSSIIVLTIKDQSVLPEYVAGYINSAIGQRLFQRYYEHTTIPFVSLTNFENMDIPVPSTARQKTLIALDEAATRYTTLSNRKQELYRQILDKELSVRSSGRRRG